MQNELEMLSPTDKKIVLEFAKANSEEFHKAVRQAIEFGLANGHFRLHWFFPTTGRIETRVIIPKEMSMSNKLFAYIEALVEFFEDKDVTILRKKGITYLDVYGNKSLEMTVKIR